MTGGKIGKKIFQPSFPSRNGKSMCTVSRLHELESKPSQCYMCAYVHGQNSLEKVQ